MYPSIPISRYPLLSFFTTFLLVFALAACGGTTPPAAEDTAPTAVEPPAEESPTTAEDHAAEDDDHDHAAEATAEDDDHDHAATDDDHDHAADEAAATDDDHDHASESASIDDLVAALQPIEEGATLNVVATTSIVGDVVSQVGGDTITLTTLMPAGADPHSFEPTPQEVGTIAQADVVFVNGFNLEERLLLVIENSGIAPERIIPVSVGVETIEFAAAEEHAAEEHEHMHSGVDPHTWMSPANVLVWTDNIAATFAALDPANADTYTTNAVSYTADLEELDAWITEQIAQIPQENRELVTDHTAFGYYAHEYGLEQIGAVVPATSTLAEPSAQELADLQEAIVALKVPAIFVGTTVNPAMAEQVAADTGVQLLSVYTGSLSAADGPAPTYIDMMRYNTEQFVTGLSE